MTPFDKDERVDGSAFRGLIRHVIDNVDGLVPCGTTGEFPYLSVEEQERLIEIAVEEAVISKEAMNEEVMIVLATVDPKALDRHAL